MGRILRRPQFVDDLYDVWDFIAKDSEVHADAFVRELEQRYRLLSDNPQLGPKRFPRYPEMRMFPFRRYIIIYACAGGRIRHRTRACFERRTGFSPLFR